MGNVLIPKIIGVVHLPPLPGSPNFAGSMDTVIECALQDCKTYHDSGLDGIIVENFGDAPFTAYVVPAVTVAAMTLAASEMKSQFPDIHLGMNVLRNDAESALSIATVVKAEFIRVNVHVGAVLADQGIIQGKAYETLRLRKSLNSEVKIFADVGVKHSAPIGDYRIEQQAADALERGLADAIIITGSRTGVAVDMQELRQLRQRFPEAKIIIGSGASSTNVRKLLKYADSVIVGTSVKVGGITSNRVDSQRLKDFMRAAKA